MAAEEYLPPVSIVTPSFNQAAFLEQTIHSVLIQDYPRLEYIIVDGGSDDGSLEIIRKYSDQLAWWVSEPDRGQAQAINKGLSRARGEILAWLNSDDMYLPGAVAAAVGAFRDHPGTGLVLGNAVTIDQDNRPLNDLKFGEVSLQDLISFRVICQPAVFMRRQAFEKAGGLDESYHMLLDHHLWIRVARNHKLVHVPEILAFARHHPGAKNVAQAERFGQEAYRILAWMETQPDLRGMIAANQRKVYAGAHRFNARYLLDGGRARPAFKAYLRSLQSHPKTALREAHRMFFALLSLVGLRGLGAVYYQLQRRRIPASLRGRGGNDVRELYDGLPVRREKVAHG